MTNQMTSAAWTATPAALKTTFGGFNYLLESTGLALVTVSDSVEQAFLELQMAFSAKAKAASSLTITK